MAGASRPMLVSLPCTEETQGSFVLANQHEVRCGRVSQGRVALHSVELHGEAAPTTCVSARSSDQLLAVGLGDGRIVLPHSRYAVRYISPRAPRTCFDLAWHPSQATQLLAAYDRARGEPGVVLWEMPAADRGSVDAAVTFATGDVATCVAWYPAQPSTFLLAAGASAAKHVRLHDVRNATSAPILTTVAHSRGTSGIAFDPCRSHRFLTWSNASSHVKVWDARRLAEAVRIEEVSGTRFVSVAWAPDVPDQLVVLRADQPCLDLWSLRDPRPGLAIPSGSALPSLAVASVAAMQAGTQARAAAAAAAATVAASPSAQAGGADAVSADAAAATAAADAGDDYAPVLVRRVSPPGDEAAAQQRRILAFCHDSSSRDRVLVLQVGGRILSMAKHAAPLVRFSPQMPALVLAQACLAAVHHIARRDGSDSGDGGDGGGDVLSEDVTYLMRQRAIDGYGLPASATDALCRDNQHSRVYRALHGVWGWLAHVIATSPKHLALGVCGLDPHDADAGGDLAFLGVNALFGDTPDRLRLKYATHFDMYRQNLLRIIGHGYAENEAFIAMLEDLQSVNQYERAAALALFRSDLELAITILRRGGERAAGRAEPDLKLVAMVLAGYTDASPLWVGMCRQFMQTYPNAYLRAIFAFLSCTDESFDQVLQLNGILMVDKLAFAARFLDDTRLADFVTSVAGRSVMAGNLDGIIFTGINGMGVRLLQRYVDRSGDVQTAALIASLAADDEAVAPHAAVWLDVYRDLLDRWHLFTQRARLDVALHRPVAAQVAARCNFCHKQLTMPQPGGGIVTGPGSGSHVSTRGGGGGRRSVITRDSIVSHCPSCRKPLPKCALCLMSLECAVPTQPDAGSAHHHRRNTSASTAVVQEAAPPTLALDRWFTWCQSCGHGGHAQHVLQWFAQHDACPVTGCSCTCLAQDLRTGA